MDDIQASHGRNRKRHDEAQRKGARTQPDCVRHRGLAWEECSSSRSQSVDTGTLRVELPSAIEESVRREYQSHHWDSKSIIVEYIENDLPALAEKSTFVYLGTYNTNALLSPRSDPKDGKFKFIFPLTKDTRMPMLDQKESTGLFVKASIEDEKPGIKLLAHDTDSYLTTQVFAGVWSKASGKEARVVEVTIDVMHEKFGLPKEV